MIVSALYTANVIQWSLRYGRLATDPVADDVTYLIDGFQRLNVLDTAGFRAFCNYLVQTPPHSPWSTALATLAFALMGVHDWAPYILNGFLVFLLLLVAWDLVDVRSAISRAAVVSVVLLLQLPFQAVHEFRPDFAVALFTAMFALILVKMGCYANESRIGIPPVDSPGCSRYMTAARAQSSDIQNHFYAGLIAGLAYLTKPTFFAHTTVMLAAAFFLAEVNRQLISDHRLHASSEIPATVRPPLDRLTVGIIRRLLATLAGAVLVAGPYFFLNWRHVLEYFLANTGSGKDSALWKIPGGFWAALWSRLHGYSLDNTLGPFSRLLALWLLISIGFAVARRNRQAVCFTLSGLALAALSLVVISAGDMVDPHFSYTWIILFLLTTLFGVAEMVKSQRASFLAGVFFLMSIFVFYKATPTRNVWQIFKDTVRGNSMNEAIVRTIASRTATDHGSSTAIVYSTFMGKVNAITQNWLALTDGLHLVFRDLHRSGDIEEHLAAIQAAHFVEVADPGSRWLDRWLPGAPLQKTLLEKLRTFPDFHELSPITGTEGTVFLFEKVEVRH